MGNGIQGSFKSGAGKQLSRVPFPCLNNDELRVKCMFVCRVRCKLLFFCFAFKCFNDRALVLLLSWF